MDIVFLGLSITSSWGNGHATTYRGLVRELVRSGHRVTFLERDVSWYAEHRDLPASGFGTVSLYRDLADLRARFADVVRRADAVVVGSYVPDGIAVGDWVQAEANGITAFYDIDTPVTLAALLRGEGHYLAARQVPGFDLYLSFAGGPTLDVLERRFGSPCARPFYCSFDPDLYFPQKENTRWDLGYMGTYSDDRQPVLDRLMLEPARELASMQFIVAGPLYPEDMTWPANVDREEHVPPSAHRAFYNAQRFTLNVTRQDMVQAGYSPSVRLFEAAACGTAIISDPWPGLETFFELGTELLVATDTREVVRYLAGISDGERRAIGERAQARVLASHTAAHRARALEELLFEPARRRPTTLGVHA